MTDMNTRKSLSERIARANAARERDLWNIPDKTLIDAERRAAFEICDIYCVHAGELLEITNQISSALPSRAAYIARTDPQATNRPENRSLKAHVEIENPACVFAWEVRHNKNGALATAADKDYAEALNATDVLKDLWEDEPALNDLQIAKALITQTVLLDEDLREVVLKRASIMARECSLILAPYLRAGFR